jgi:hypothetical protein
VPCRTSWHFAARHSAQRLEGEGVLYYDHSSPAHSFCSVLFHFAEHCEVNRLFMDIDSLNSWKIAHDQGEISPTHPTHSRWWRWSPLDFPLDLEECHRKFGDASCYRDQMHKEQTDRHSSLYIYRYTINSFIKYFLFQEYWSHTAKQSLYSWLAWSIIYTTSRSN